MKKFVQGSTHSFSFLATKIRCWSGPSNADIILTSGFFLTKFILHSQNYGYSSDRMKMSGNKKLQSQHWNIIKNSASEMYMSNNACQCQ
jgi:hypothetical protein